MNLVEYLYIDHTRLNSYFEQYSPPTKFEKVQAWDVEFSITGPKASGSQLRPGRPFTTHEKISLLLHNLPLERLTIKSAFLYVRMEARRLVLSLKLESGAFHPVQAMFQAQFTGV